ncbi:hypothetical protein SCHPADRAFT_752839 [Schizopora paradoxa]|uniref:Uncharacterized protein n=1 Tax=Schizopora paradoxa TaxID=27342 RepID=A0A0H2RI34_9AGAM|nr:hypothetical protein SCHPADRAFT_752839 [Schizopora paradoxa]
MAHASDSWDCDSQASVPGMSHSQSTGLGSSNYSARHLLIIKQIIRKADHNTLLDAGNNAYIALEEQLARKNEELVILRSLYSSLVRQTTQEPEEIGKWDGPPLLGDEMFHRMPEPLFRPSEFGTNLYEPRKLYSESTGMAIHNNSERDGEAQIKQGTSDFPRELSPLSEHMENPTQRSQDVFKVCFDWKDFRSFHENVPGNIHENIGSHNAMDEIDENQPLLIPHSSHVDDRRQTPKQDPGNFYMEKDTSSTASVNSDQFSDKENVNMISVKNVPHRRAGVSFFRPRKKVKSAR